MGYSLSEIRYASDTEIWACGATLTPQEPSKSMRVCMWFCVGAGVCECVSVCVWGRGLGDWGYAIISGMRVASALVACACEKCAGAAATLSTCACSCDVPALVRRGLDLDDHEHGDDVRGVRVLRHLHCRRDARVRGDDERDFADERHRGVLVRRWVEAEGRRARVCAPGVFNSMRLHHAFESLLSPCVPKCVYRLVATQTEEQQKSYENG